MRFAFNVPLALCFEVEADDPISALERAKAAIAWLDKADAPIFRNPPYALQPVFQTAGVTFADMIDETESIAASCNCGATTKSPGSWHVDTCPLFAT